MAHRPLELRAVDKVALGSSAVTVLTAFSNMPPLHPVSISQS